MRDALRVPMVGHAEVAVGFEMGPRIGRRFYMDVDEHLLVGLGEEAIAYATQHLAEAIVHRHSVEIEAAVHSYILKREWAEPTIRAEVRRAVHAVIEDMLGNSPLGEALRGGTDGR